MKSWKKRLSEELDLIVPELRDDVKSAPIPNGHEEINYNGGHTAVKSRNIVISVLAVAAACLIALIICIALLSPKKSVEFMFTIEINPAITMVTDEKGTVKAVMASNADADVILSADGVKENIEGRDIAEAAAYYTDCAARLGYIDMESGGSAVRVSGYKSGDKLLDRTKGSLEDYFISKGVYAAVIAESVGKEQFSERSGVPSGTDETMSKFIAEIDTLYSVRDAEGRSIEELSAMYKNSKSLQDLITFELRQNLDRIAKNAKDIGNLVSLYFEIFNHEDNPALSVLKGYWEVKKYYGDKIDGEFAQLVEEMDRALQDYKDDYGVGITSILELQSVANSYLTVTVEQIAELIDNFTYDVFDGLSSALAEIMSAAGIDIGNISELIKLPQTVGQYFEKTSSLLKTEYGLRTEKYADIYGAVREPVTRSDYDGYIRDIVSRYGTLENYWQTIKG